MKMHAYTHLSISTILSRTRLIWVPIIGFFLLRETLSFFDYGGILIIFLGVSVIIAPKKLFIDKGVVYANTAAIIIALNVVFLKMAIPYASNSVLNALMSIPSIILYPLIMKNPTERIKILLQANLPLKSLAGGISILQLFILIAALNIGDPSKINAIYQGMLIFSVIAGILFLKERKDIGKKVICAIITVIDVVILSIY